METLQKTKAKAVKEFKAATKEQKDILINIFGKEIFTPESIMDKVKTFEDACMVQGIDPKSVFTKTDSKDVIAYKKLKVIRNALNEGVKLNWSDSNQYKYYPWFNMPGSGFSFYVYAYDFTFSCVGSRLCYVSGELAEYAGKQFVAIYKDYMTE